MRKVLNVSTHSHLKVAELFADKHGTAAAVSTHSHLKVAEGDVGLCAGGTMGFNTQPPEGG